MEYIYKHYDGPLYIVPAKTGYDPKQIAKLNIDITFPVKYFAAHFPLYPFAIKLFAYLTGYLRAMVGVNLLFSVLLVSMYLYVLKAFNLTRRPLLLAFVFIMLPRFLVVRSIGAPETMFMFLTLASLFCFEKKSYLLAGLLGGLATMTKSPGILLFFAYMLVCLEYWFKNKKFSWQWVWILLIPVGLLSVFLIYLKQYGDFFAYFHSGNNIHLVAPFAVFNYQAKWVGTAWLEDVLFFFFMYALTVYQLKDSKQRSFFYYAMVFFAATTFVQHRDISRYSLPIWLFTPIAFEKFFTSKKFMIVLIILLPAIFLYAWNFSLFNIMPIGEWKPFL